MKSEKKSKKKKQMFSWINPKIKHSIAQGYGKGEMGVFAEEEIEKEEILAIFGGYIMTIQEEERLPKGMNDYALQINEKFVIGIKNKNEINCDAYFNHSCNPNAGFKGQIFLVAMRNIKEKEEITFDYAMAISNAEGAKYYKMKCLCGSRNCRGYITEDDWKNKKLQKKYNGYFQYYLQQKIKNK